MKDTDFIYIPGWAVNQLKLKGNELLIYSIIFSYTRDGVQWYKAPAEYLASCVGSSVSTTKEVLKRLTDKGYLAKSVDEYKGSVNRVYYKAVQIEHDQYENGTGVPVPESYGCTSTETVLNNTNKKNSIQSSGISRKRSLLSTVSPDADVKKPKITKFVQTCHIISKEFEFDSAVSDALVDFFTMLAESGSFLPEITIRAQLEDLMRIDSSSQLHCIQDTIKSGWKSLKYAVDAVVKSKASSFDTSKPDAFQPKNPLGDDRWKDYEGDDEF